MAREKNGSVLKILGVIMLAIIVALGVGIDTWYLYVKLHAPTKQVVNTYNVSMQTLANGSDTKPFVEIKYFSNANKNGYECFEIKFNYFTDESKNKFFAKGLQLIPDSKTGQIELKEEFEYQTNTHYEWRWNGNCNQYDKFYRLNPTDGTEAYCYASDDNFETAHKSTSPLGDKSYFTIQIGDNEEDMFLMQFKASLREKRTPDVYADKIYSDNDYWSPAIYSWEKNTGYVLQDVNYFAKTMYDSISGGEIKNGTKSFITFEFGDLFDYYQYDTTKKDYSDTAVKDSTKVISKMKSYYSIYVEKYADGVRKASESLFNCVQGSSAFNLTGDYTSDDYFMGRTIINCNLSDCDLVKAEDNYYCVQLSQNFQDYYIKYADLIYLSLEIDLDALHEKNMEFFGFTKNSGLDKFEIMNCYTIETINGEKVRTEVQYVDSVV